MRVTFDIMTEKLIDSKEWKTVIDEGYFEVEAQRLVMASGNLQITPDQAANIQKMISGISFFHQFIVKMIQNGRVAQNELDEYDEYLQENVGGE